ncbi:MauE/DoxX family redox-associated membrane protein [Sphaerisporangium sp. NPDC004334]
MITYVAIVCRVALVVVFAASFFGKVRSRKAFYEFALTLRAVPMRSPRWAMPVAGAVVAAEGAVPLLLISTATAPLGFFLALLLLLAFSAVTAWSLRRGVTVPCRCFGTSRSSLGMRHLVRNAILIAAAAAGLADVSGGPLLPEHLLVGAMGGLLVALPLITMDQLVELFTV